MSGTHFCIWASLVHNIIVCGKMLEHINDNDNIMNIHEIREVLITPIKRCKHNDEERMNIGEHVWEKHQFEVIEIRAVL